MINCNYFFLNVGFCYKLFGFSRTMYYAWLLDLYVLLDNVFVATKFTYLLKSDFTLASILHVMIS